MALHHAHRGRGKRQPLAWHLTAPAMPRPVLARLTARMVNRERTTDDPVKA